VLSELARLSRPKPSSENTSPLSRTLGRQIDFAEPKPSTVGLVAHGSDPRSRRRSERDVNRRAYGQNFIESKTLAAELVADAEILPDHVVVEPGAGRGVLTVPLAERAEHVYALEIDAHWVAVLRKGLARFTNVEVVESDTFSFRSPPPPFRVFGNIPFGISTRILHHYLNDLSRGPGRADLIVQLQVARKRANVTHPPLLNVTWAPWYSFQLGRVIPANAFRPKPSVDAAVLTISLRSEPLLPHAEQASFTSFAKAGFASGGILRPALRQRLTGKQVRVLQRQLGFGAEARASDLDIDTWLELYRAVEQLSG
jgi:23S rRNA (adenine-N6)-dimethyltransferase